MVDDLGGHARLGLAGELVVISKLAIMLAVMPCIFGYLLHKPKKAALR